MVAQVFIGRKTYVTNVYGCKTEENIRERGAMDCLISDGAKSETLAKVVNILRMYKCGNYMSELEHQHKRYLKPNHGPDWSSGLCVVVVPDLRRIIA